MDRNHIEKIAQTPEDRILLAKLWDKVQAGMTRNIPAHSCFLTPRELEMARYLFGTPEGLCVFGGYSDAERQMLIYLPEYLDESFFMTDAAPIHCLRAKFYEGDNPTHRDFLGALMGDGIAREAVGDICVGKGYCDFFVTEEIAPYLLENFNNAGRTKFHLTAIPLADAHIPEAEVEIIKDTVASLRLDSVISAGFRISRSKAADAITAGKVAMNGLLCEKPDRQVSEGCKISLRGSGKIKLFRINGQTKKGRISVEIHRYL